MNEPEPADMLPDPPPETKAEDAADSASTHIPPVEPVDPEPPWLPPPAEPATSGGFPVWLRVVSAGVLLGLAIFGIPYPDLFWRGATVLVGLRILGVPGRVLLIVVGVLLFVGLAFLAYVWATCKPMGKW